MLPFAGNHSNASVLTDRISLTFFNLHNFSFRSISSVMIKKMSSHSPVPSTLSSSSFFIRDILSSKETRDKQDLNYSSPSHLDDQSNNDNLHHQNQMWNNSLGLTNSNHHSVSASFAAAAAALLPSFMMNPPSNDKRMMGSMNNPYDQQQPHLHHPFLASHHDLFLHHISRATASVANHVASHRRRKARTVFSDSQLHGLEKR